MPRRLAAALLVLVAAQVAAALSVGSFSRRAALLGVAGSSLHSLSKAFPAAAALSDAEMQGILDRAKTNRLTTDGVILRAVRNDLLDPNDITDCKIAEKMSRIDMEAAEEVRIANGKLEKMIHAAKAAGADSKIPPLAESLRVGGIVEQRISQRAQQFSERFINECMAPST